MATSISDAYRNSVRRAVRRSSGTDVDAEIDELITEARQDLSSYVLSIKIIDETDPLVLGAIKCYVRWKFGLENPDAAANKEDYLDMVDNLRHRAGYGYEEATS